MASIKLKGDTSGEITIQAPSVAGTNTLNLQASSGTLATTAQASIGTKNLIINGNMKIAQRGTSATGITSTNYHTVDRWKTDYSALGTWTQTQDTDVPTGQGFSNSLKMQCTTADASPAAGDYLSIRHSIEGQNLQHLKYGTSSAESMTLSFWVKSNKTGTYNVMCLQDDNAVEMLTQAYTINTGNTWEKKTLTIVGDVDGIINDDNGTGLRMHFYLGAGSNRTSGSNHTEWSSYLQANEAPNQVNLADSTSNYINITGLQLEVGTEATPFENIPYDLNLQKCMRYYQRFDGGAAFTVGINGVYNDTVNLIGLHQHIVPFRATPTFSYSAISHFDLEPFDTQPTSLTSNASGNLYQASVTGIDPTSRVRGYGGTITCDNAAGYFDFSAEL